MYNSYKLSSFCLAQHHNLLQITIPQKLKNLTHIKIITFIVLTLEQFGFTLWLFDKDDMANMTDPDQTALSEQFDAGLHCLLRPTCNNIQNFHSNSYYVITI